jgi:hypothetical protein
MDHPALNIIIGYPAGVSIGRYNGRQSAFLNPQSQIPIPKFILFRFPPFVAADGNRPSAGRYRALRAPENGSTTTQNPTLECACRRG